MQRYFSYALLLFSTLGLGAHFWLSRELRHGPGVVAPLEPAQTMLQPFDLPARGEWHLQAVALYEFTARVLHTRRYFGSGSELVPMDVAVGWGRMSDESILDRLTISQSSRFFFYEWAIQPPLPQDELIAHAANVHVIAASDRVAADVRWLRRGEVVTMTGYLVNATRPDGAHWYTSLSRTDTGNGACELFYAEEIKPGATASLTAESAPQR